jgi:hypothetical protein
MSESTDIQICIERYGFNGTIEGAKAAIDDMMERYYKPMEDQNMKERYERMIDQCETERLQEVINGFRLSKT